MMQKNKITVIGFMGIMKCYINLEEEEAILRYCEYDNITREEFDDLGYKPDSFEVNDEFFVYDAWK